ncbi:hypothetical protein [Streptomyces sp. NBC_01017]|uniref:HNH endonuclease n=1 Tax=Streptomyces sp. NBC_01017 TaxID=2903721 RepID=UPI00386C85D2
MLRGDGICALGRRRRCNVHGDSLGRWRHPTEHAAASRSPSPATRGRNAGRSLRRDPAHPAARGSSHRHPAGHGQHEQRADHGLLAEYCEIWETRTNVEVHHVRKLADLNRPGRRERPTWVHLMAMRRRKTLVICRAVKKTSTRDVPPHHPGSDHWRAGSLEIGPARFGKGRRKGTRATGTLRPCPTWSV